MPTAGYDIEGRRYCPGCALAETYRSCRCAEKGHSIDWRDENMVCMGRCGAVAPKPLTARECKSELCARCMEVLGHERKVRRGA